jgi:glyceraldehyde 3-phosphate dehydrogenase
MSTKKVAINGFGRIGRLAARNILTKFPDLEIVAVNDLTSPENLAYLFKYDSTYRQFEYDVATDGENLIIHKPSGQVKIKVLSQKDPAMLPWSDLGVDVVLECTGRFLTREAANLHLQNGVKKVVLSAPAKDEDIATTVLGVNSLPTDNVISNASCTTNCVSPALKVLNDIFRIEEAVGITVHAYTATQLLQDGPSQKDYRDGRAAGINMIPSKTGAAKAVYKVLPELKGKLGLSAIRVPVITGSMVYLTLNLEKDFDKQAINNAFKAAADNQLKGILEFSTEELVSGDIIQNSHSCIVDGNLTEVLGKTAKVVLWYDNEWGYANRLVEVINQSAE